MFSHSSHGHVAPYPPRYFRNGVLCGGSQESVHRARVLVNLMNFGELYFEWEMDLNVDLFA